MPPSSHPRKRACDVYLFLFVPWTSDDMLSISTSHTERHTLFSLSQPAHAHTRGGECDLTGTSMDIHVDTSTHHGPRPYGLCGSDCALCLSLSFLHLSTTRL